MSVFVSGGVGVGVNVGVGVGVRVFACMCGMAVGDMTAISAPFGVGASTCVICLVFNTFGNLGNFRLIAWSIRQPPKYSC